MSENTLPKISIGDEIFRLTVIEKLPPDKHRKIHWLCRCDCGGSATPSTRALRSGNTRSCGCLKIEQLVERRRTHGKSRSPEYRNWCAMKERCYSRSHKNYDLYGGRGITVCERWLNSFENFLADMGYRPFPRATVERDDTNGNYEPDNCRWATQKEQTRNTRRNFVITANGVSLTLAEWAEATGISRGTIWSRIKRTGLTPEQAIDPQYQRRKRGPASAYAT